MKIRTKLHLSTLCAILTTLLIGVIVVVTVQQLRDKSHHVRITTDFIQGVFTLNLFTADYLLYPDEERPKRQWQLQYDMLTRLLETIALHNHKHQAIVMKMHTIHKTINQLFLQVQAHHERSVRKDRPNFSGQLQEQVQGQLLMELQNIIFYASQLVTENEEELLSIQKRANVLILSAMSVLVVFIGGIALITGKKIVQPILQLQQGAEIISTGNLEFHIPTGANDEIGYLARTFNRMVRELKQVMISRSELEQHVEERTADLMELNVRLKTEIEEHQQTAKTLRQSQEDYQRLAGKLLTAQEAERRRLAREMHDDLTQRLAVQAIEIGKIEAQAQDLPAPIAEKLRVMKAEMMNLSEDIHAISRQLHPSILDDLGLVDAISSKCQRFTKQEGIVIDYTTDSVPSAIPRDIALGLYRILQEGLQNIAKHAQTTEASVSLSGTNGTLELALQDCGVGFDPVQGKQSVGLGLVSMEERVHLLRGEWLIHSQPGEGTLIKVRVPLK